ncbi:hypothetical protein CU669_00170 [Paramagnetospirillum kuznetsovii]|uniref:NAD-dependent epimerase/dehydratase domain-containing protein n=1 Tax=Paramagnetospirillum kuznetsovii TaxID=2053833 RepID=A0A364P2H5_9PROT|nr:NAD(P)-dependent oxidoreductase [Paramagnetospirillum kuznetsovii]RAU23558.1 hypothetical protein CU669_00170 [Paramagnetospirillum kuznetsovii]
MTQSVLVTGGTGYIGYCLVRRLGELFQDVHVLTRGGDAERLNALPRRPTLHRAPADGGKLAALVTSIAPGQVFHLAAPPGRAGPAMIDDYLRYSLYLMEGAAAVSGLRFVNVGTWWQIGDDGRYKPTNLYAAAKQAVHDLLVHYASQGMSACTCAPFDVYGPGDWRGRFVSALCRAFETKMPATEGIQLVNLIHVDDVVNGLLAAAAAEEEGCPLYTLGSGEPMVSLRQVAERVAALAGRPPLVDWGSVGYGPGQVFRPCPADRPPPGWTPAISLDDGLLDVLAHG